jgi:hypothetical protein
MLDNLEEKTFTKIYETNSGMLVNKYSILLITTMRVTLFSFVLAHSL